MIIKRLIQKAKIKNYETNEQAKKLNFKISSLNARKKQEKELSKNRN